MTNARKFTVALVQMCMGADPEANFSSALRHIREAARRGAQIVCLPELFRTQYFCQREDLKLFDLAEPIPGPSTKKLAEVAREAGVVIIASLFERRAPGLYHNTAVTLNSDGQIAGIYRKMHIPDDPLYFEKYYFAPGDLGFQAVDTSAGRVGALVCWDQWFPEAARLTVLQGAELLFYPTAIGWHPAEKDEFGAAQYDAWQTVQRAHAIANGVYVAAVNRVGHEQGDVLGNRASGPGLEFWGGSFLADPFGRIVAKASHESEEILLGEIDRTLIEETRRNWPFLRDRRVDAYAPITQRFLDAEGGQNAVRGFDADRNKSTVPQSYLSETAKKLLNGPRYSAADAPKEKNPGVYALFFNDNTELPGLSKCSSDLAYIGVTREGFVDRNPLQRKESSGHSVRRTIGAILKSELSLKAIPRADGNVASFRFLDPGEDRLTAWMQQHLTVNFVPITDSLGAVESALIREFCPPLNLTNPHNPNLAVIKRARKECQKEAILSGEES